MLFCPLRITSRRRERWSALGMGTGSWVSSLPPLHPPKQAPSQSQAFQCNDKDYRTWVPGAGSIFYWLNDFGKSLRCSEDSVSYLNEANSTYSGVANFVSKVKRSDKSMINPCSKPYICSAYKETVVFRSRLRF